MSALSLLKSARTLIANQLTWTTGVLARDRNGNRVAPHSPIACSFCSDGALIRANACGSDADYSIAANALSREVGMPFHAFNDKYGYPEVLKMWDATIARIESHAAVEMAARSLPIWKRVFTRAYWRAWLNS